MKSTWPLLWSLALAALAAPENPEALTPVAIETRFEYDAPPRVREAARREVESIMAPLALRFQWLGAEHGDVSAQLVVLTFQGGCEPRRPAPAGPATGALGWTHVSDGVVLPFAVVDCDRVREFVAESLRRTPGTAWEAIMGRALGRVAAHELYHALARTGHHGDGGVGRPYFSVRELTGSEFRFARHEFGALRANLRAAGSPAAGRVLFQGAGCASCHGERGAGTRWAPALRGRRPAVDLARVDDQLARGIRRMYHRVRGRRLTPPVLEGSQIGDLESYLATPLE